MELLTQKLPSGYNYPFTSLRLKPMNFAQILEYMATVPKNPVDKFYFDYTVVLDDDPNINNLLLCDLDYVVFFKKGITISKKIEFTVEPNCPECGSSLLTTINLNKTKFIRLTQEALNGYTVDINESYHNVRMPFIFQFMNIFSKYKKFKNVTDMSLIKLIALFEQVEMYLNRYEDLVTNATHQDILVLIISRSA
jgi:hypothetical protein